MKKALILFGIMSIFAFSCSWIDKGKDKIDEIQNENPPIESNENDMIESKDTIPGDSIIS